MDDNEKKQEIDSKVEKNNSILSIVLIISLVVVVLVAIGTANGFSFFKKDVDNLEKEVTWKLERDDDISCASVITKIYEDNDYIYNVSDPCVATGTYVVFSSGERYTVKDAVNNGKVTIADLEGAGIKIYKDSKKVTWKIEQEDDLMCASAITKIYEDNDYTYSVADPCVATGTYVVFSSGERYTVKDAVNNGKVTISDLEKAGIKIYKDSKKVTWKIEQEDDLMCASVITKIYEDNDYIYNVSDPCVATGTYVVFSSGERYTVKDAVNNGKVTIADLEGAGIKIYKDSKKVTWKIEQEDDLMCASAITKIYEDNDYTYSVADPCVATGTYVVFSSGERYTVKDAVNNGKVTISDLEKAGIKIYKDSKKVTWKIEQEDDLMCASVITKIYEDNDYIYNVSDPCVATGTYVVFSSGERYTVKDAVNNGKVTITDLEGAGIKIYKDKK